MRLAILIVAVCCLSCALDAPIAIEDLAWTVRVSPQAVFGVEQAASDADKYLRAMGRVVTIEKTTDGPECAAGQGQVVLLGDGLGEARFDSTPTEQTWRIEEERCARGGVLVHLSGGGLLGRQYAVYEWLHRLGVRFFHPEDEFVPETPRFSDEPIVIEHTPSFVERSASLHLTHPLELGDAFSLGNASYFEEARRYIDWHVKNGATEGPGGIGADGLSDYGFRRGFPRSGGISLHNNQQSSMPLIDPDDPRPVNEQIAEAIEDIMDVPQEVRPTRFGVNFAPSEFTELPDTDIVNELTFISNYFAEHYPNVVLSTINHGTHGEPTDTYNVRFFDLPKFAPPNLRVNVHPLMFYDMFRPAPVYGNDNFEFLYDFMVDQYQVRGLTYFPEAAWWLTFDIAVPLYLPITIEARDRDIQGISFMLAKAGDDKGLFGHRVFGTGHEWGYWQNEYCSYRMAADTAYRYTDCFADITSIFGGAAQETQAVLEAVVERQQQEFFDASLLAYLVGTDPETEVADSVGIHFHPLPPTPAAILRWDATQVDAFETQILPRLQQMDQAYAELVGRLHAVSQNVPANSKRFFDEILDGIEVTGLRAKHAWQAYGALVQRRKGQLQAAPDLVAGAEAMLANAEMTTTAVLDVIHRRELGYRYAPLSRSIAGGPDGTQDDNWTVYDYRYLNRTNRGYYFTRIDQLAREAFAGARDPIEIEDALIEATDALVVRVVDTSLTDAMIDYGDGSIEAATADNQHTYSATGVYQVTVTALREGESVQTQAMVAVVDAEVHGGFSASVVEPAAASLIEGVMPAFVYGAVDSERVAVGFSARHDGAVASNFLYIAARATSDSFVATEPMSFLVPVVNRGNESVSTTIIVDDGVLSRSMSDSPMVISGNLSSESVVHAIVAIGGFREEGARNILAATLGYTPDALPAELAFTLEYRPE